jgi:hypothetical protein
MAAKSAQQTFRSLSQFTILGEIREHARADPMCIVFTYCWDNHLTSRISVSAIAANLAMQVIKDIIAGFL